MIADQRVIENIKKLKELGMSKNEIKENLTKMGLSDKDCEELILKAANKDKTNNEDSKLKTEKVIKIEDNKTESKNIEKPKNELPKDLFKENNINLNKIDDKKLSENKIFSSENIDISKELKIEELEDLAKDENISLFSKEIETSENKIKNTVKDKPKIKEEIDSDFLKQLENSYSKEATNIKKESTKENISKNNFDFNVNSNNNIWQTGLVSTINSKLTDIENKQKQVESYLKDKIDNEINKYSKIQKTNQQLLIHQVNESISQEVVKIQQSSTRQLIQVKIEQAKLNKKTSEIKSGKQEIEEALKEFNKTKENLLEDNTKVQDEIKKLSATTSVKLNAKMKQINEILTLQSRISQGLIKNTQQAINTKITELSDFKNTINSQIDPHKLYEKLNEIEKFKEQLASRYENRFENVKTEFLKKAQVAFKNELHKELTDIKKVRDDIANKTDPEIINKKIEELEIFEKHLLNNIDEKISQSLKIYESGINQEFKNKISRLDDYYSKVENLIKKIENSQETLKEINNFKDQFIAIIDKNIEKMNSKMTLIDDKLKSFKKDDNKNI
jgi:hypothetical protein